MQNERFKGMQTREMQLSGIRVLNEDDRTVELSFSSETPIERWGAFEVLSHTKSAVQLNRILTTGCLLYNHNRDTVIGKICSAKVENKRGVAVVQFDEDEKSDIIFQKVKNGSLRGVSVGYTIQDYKKDVTGQGEARQVTYTATKWEPYEISIVSVPADISVGVGRSMEDDITQKSNIRMFENQIKLNENLLMEDAKSDA